MEAVFTFTSTHDAIHGERLLLEAGVPVRVMALPSSIGAGCGLCLRVAADALESSRALLEGGGVIPEGRYLKETHDGRVTYTKVG